LASNKHEGETMMESAGGQGREYGRRPEEEKKQRSGSGKKGHDERTSQKPSEEVNNELDPKIKLRITGI